MNKSHRNQAIECCRLVAAIGVVIGLLAIFMHRANIKRLLSGTEKKATFSKFRRNKSI